MDPVVSSHTRLSRYITGCTIIKSKQQRRWREETNKHGIRTAKCRKVKLALFSNLCMLVAIVRILRKSYTTLKDADSSGHRFHWSVSSFLTAYRPLNALDSRFRAYSLLRVLSLTARSQVLSSQCLSLCSVVSLLNDYVLRPPFRSRGVLRA